MAGLKNIIFTFIVYRFYIIPRFIKDTGSAVIVMLMIIPLICLITSVFMESGMALIFGIF